MNKSKINIRRAPYALMLCALLAGCSEEKYDINLDPIEEPMDVAMAEYVNGFDVLKKYIDFESHPGFRLGASVSSTELIGNAVQPELYCTPTLPKRCPMIIS